MGAIVGSAMTRIQSLWLFAGPGLAVAILSPMSANAQTTGRDGEIIVTAQKQEQATNSVGMSITAATGDTLRVRGINSVADLPALVPGLTIQRSEYNSTSFTLRGVGFFNSDLATSGAVTVYVDEAPLPYPALTGLAAFDLERVEVMKGPQGTLFGENATGGAVNYIAAKPPEELSAEIDASYGNFDRFQLGGYVGGPIDDHLRFRVALQGRRGGPWQQSITRPRDELGRISEFQARGTLEWQPVPALTSRATLTVTHDGSESQAAQFLAPIITIPALSPGLATFPIVTGTRAADWTPLLQGSTQPFPYRSDTTLYQLTWRNDLQASDAVKLTSLTSFIRFDLNYGQDPDGTPFHLSEKIDQGGRVTSIFQELRATGRIGRLDWLVGGNFEHESTHDDPLDFNFDNSISHVFQSVDPLAIADTSKFVSKVRATTFAAFGRLQYNLNDQLALEGSVRFNRDRRTFDNCAVARTEAFTRFWDLFRGGLPPPTRIGECYVVDTANGLRPVSNVHSELNQNSLSWRVGATWSARPGLMLYANVSKGYKAGAVPVLAAATVTQFNPVPQESLLAYEAGIKAGLLDRRLQANAAVFYYDYKGKQLRGAQLDPSFGPLQALVSIPQSHVIGAEAQLTAKPVGGLTFDVSATFVHTNIDRFTGFDALANFGDQSGSQFPFSPKWQVIANVDYEFHVTHYIDAFVGSSLQYRSKAYAGIGELPVMSIDPYTLLDLRAGITDGSGKYRVWVWGRNVTNTYYWTNVFTAGDSISRFVGQPATYGVSMSTRL